ncbi:hypothetical protein FQN49_003954 [Arthroderma sp. PD_2]|nr:hypothetical protein FQN49_003954 [Arthroderma sp. PD_2]
MSSKLREGDSQDDGSSLSEDDLGEWSYGDGICPSQSQFVACCQASYDGWNGAAMVPRDTECSSLRMGGFLGLLPDIPAFFHWPKDANVTGGGRSPLVLRASLVIETTEDETCSQRYRKIEYLQCLGFPRPSKFKFRLREEESPADSDGRDGRLASVVLAWSYVLSCRWAEVLRQAGEEAVLRHAQGEELDSSFWHLVTHSRWSAQVEIAAGGTSYSPWMMREKSNTAKSRGLVDVPPNSSLAFDILFSSCVSHGLEEEFWIGLAVVLMLTSRNAPTPSLSSPAVMTYPAVKHQQRDPRYQTLFESLDRCMCLSATLDALDSLLCSAFFDPSVPCNLLGAASLGVRKALLTEDGSFELLLNAISHKRPHLSFLWQAVVYTGQANQFLTLALNNLPPICLVAAFWTNTEQSFLQMTYDADEGMDTSISRAQEFTISFFCRPEASVPWSPAPPFGTTQPSNLSLEVKSHQGHKHRPISWRTYWIQLSGESTPASPRYCLGQTRQAHMIPYQTSSIVDTDIEAIITSERDMADERSWSATSRLFNWHRNNEDGLWLDDGMRTVDEIRQLQRHPWIIDPFDDGGRSERLDKGERPRLPVENILEWRDGIETDPPTLGAMDGVA